MVHQIDGVEPGHLLRALSVCHAVARCPLVPQRPVPGSVIGSGCGLTVKWSCSGACDFETNGAGMVVGKHLACPDPRGYRANGTASGQMSAAIGMGPNRPGPGDARLTATVLKVKSLA